MNASAVASFVAVVLVSASCADRSSGPTAAEQAALGGDVAARVGTDVIPVSLVTKVAAEQNLSPREALRRLVDDAICANAARARALDKRPPGSWTLTASRGRFTADRMMADARRAGVPTDAEIAELTSRHWREVDRPVAVRVVHAVVERSKTTDVASEKKARALAVAIREAVKAAHDGDEFLAMAAAVPRDGMNVVTQPLPAFEREGYVTEGPGGMDAEFAKGAFKLTTPGDTSDIVESKFGWHVIRLLEIIPEQRMPAEARRAAFTEEAYMERARVETQARVKARVATAPIEISPSAENLMRTVTVAGSPSSATAAGREPSP